MNVDEFILNKKNKVKDYLYLIFLYFVSTN